MVQPICFRGKIGFIQESTMYADMNNQLRRMYDASSDSEGPRLPTARGLSGQPSPTLSGPVLLSHSVSGRALSGQPAMVRTCLLLRRNCTHRRAQCFCLALCPTVPSLASQPWYGCVRCCAAIGVIVGRGDLHGQTSFPIWRFKWQ